MWMWMSNRHNAKTSTRRGALPVPRGAGEGSVFSKEQRQQRGPWQQLLSRCAISSRRTVSGRISWRLKQRKRGGFRRRSARAVLSRPGALLSTGLSKLTQRWKGTEGLGAGTEEGAGFGGVLVCGVVCDDASPRRVLDVSRLTCTRRAARRRPLGMCGVGYLVEVAARLERVLPRFSRSSVTMIDDFVSRFVFVVSLTTHGAWGIDLWTSFWCPITSVDFYSQQFVYMVVPTLTFRLRCFSTSAFLPVDPSTTRGRGVDI
ncbi:hypothetical protein B0H13DRAFT_1995216 [Mycena leptocephala]|nr:hypothetical protein B0H13DRAFT_1995216 [Mycena leptocephala]